MAIHLPFMSLSGSVNLPSWRVTASNPPRDDGRLDYDRCCLLHQEIIKAGWESSGRSLDDLQQRSWFDFYGAEADAVRHRLSPDLISFLEHVQEVGFDGGSFHYYVSSLGSPGHMWSNFEQLVDEGEENRFITLYTANNMASHPDGLIFDQQENRAILQMSIHDTVITHNGRQRWYPLEVVLSSWLDMIDIGKIKAVNEEVDPDNGKFNPWINLPYSEIQLQETIDVFNQLVDAIIGAMPSCSNQQDGTKEFLLDDVTLDIADIPPGFARAFLSKAHAATFRYIAPGLELPLRTPFTKQPFSAVEPDPRPEEGEESKIIMPILLFRNSGSYRRPSHNHNDDDESGSNLPFSWPYNQVHSYPSGLYLNSADREDGNVFEDEVRLVLPYGIGAHGFARTSDGARIGENRTSDRVMPRDMHADLYQPGWQPFTEMHLVRLADVLRNWLGMVQRGN